MGLENIIRFRTAPPPTQANQLGRSTAVAKPEELGSEARLDFGPESQGLPLGPRHRWRPAFL